jgi:sulfoxide reductase catalytic subunit YedY
MNIIKKRSWDLAQKEITEHDVYLNRRQFLNRVAVASAAVALSSMATAKTAEAKTIDNVVKSAFSTKEEPSTFEAITTYNNFYEFGTSKSSPALMATEFPDTSKPWMVSIEGECDKPGQYDYMELLKPYTLEERVYRMRCVEGWSMVIPWIGVPLAEVLKQALPNSKAKYVEFTTLLDPEQMPG